MAPLQRLKPQLKCDPSGTTEVVPCPTSPADRVFQRTLSRAISTNIGNCSATEVLREWRRVTSGPTLLPPSSASLSFTNCLRKVASFPRSHLKPLGLQSTPAYSVCQEGNTIGCISNNDGLYSRVGDLFSTREIHGGFIKEQKPVVSGQWAVKFSFCFDWADWRVCYRKRTPALGRSR